MPQKQNSQKTRSKWQQLPKTICFLILHRVVLWCFRCTSDAVLLRETPLKSQIALTSLARKQKEGGGNTSHTPAAFSRQCRSRYPCTALHGKLYQGLMLPHVPVPLWGLAARETNHHPDTGSCTCLRAKEGILHKSYTKLCFPVIRYAETKWNCQILSLGSQHYTKHQRFCYSALSRWKRNILVRT